MTDAGLLACRELDEMLGLTGMAQGIFKDSRLDNKKYLLDVKWDHN
jgi:hypothetical protein